MDQSLSLFFVFLVDLVYVGFVYGILWVVPLARHLLCSAKVVRFTPNPLIRKALLCSAKVVCVASNPPSHGIHRKKRGDFTCVHMNPDPAVFFLVSLCI